MNKPKNAVAPDNAQTCAGSVFHEDGGAAANACTTGPLERIANALEELVYVIKEKKNLPPTPPIRKKENTPSTESRARANAWAIPGPEDLQAEKIMKALKIGDRMYRKHLAAVPKNIV